LAHANAVTGRLGSTYKWREDSLADDGNGRLQQYNGLRNSGCLMIVGSLEEWEAGESLISDDCVAVPTAT